jgi:tetratricopeptide (TPR) repeat protein
VQAELERVLANSALRDSDLLKRFLRYSVERTLAGQGDQLKEYRVGVDVFEREETFDPRLDPVVRMAAGRLRKKLQEYYRGEGALDPIRIEIPKGRYAATFVAVEVAGSGRAGAIAEPGAASPGIGKAALDAKVVWAVILLLACGAGMAGRSYYRSRQSRRLTDKDTVILADFANRTGDPLFDGTLKTGLAIALQQSPFLSVVSEQRVAATLQAMTRPPGTKLTPDLAGELCQRTGSKAYIAGTIAGMGGEYVLDLKAVNCRNGDTLAREQATATAKESVLPALGEAASRLRGQLGESLATVQKFDVPLVEATTSSLEALKAYSQGEQAFREKGPAAALPYAQQAIGLDPNFAAAYAEVGMDYSSLGQVGRAREYFTKAFQLREHASQREKLAIDALYYRNVTGELEKTLEARQQLVAGFPREFRGFTSLSTDFASLGQYEPAIEATREALRLNPDHVVPYDDLAEYLLAQQRFDEAREIIQQAQSRGLDNLLLHNALYAMGFLRGDFAALEEQEKWYAGRPEENYGLALSADTEAYSGHVEEARLMSRRAQNSALAADSQETAAIWQANEALWEAAYGYPRQAEQFAAAALKTAPASQGVQVEAALAFAMAGSGARAESMARDLNQDFPLDTQVQSLWLPAVRAQVALERKDSADALAALPMASSLDVGLIPFVNNISCLYPVYVRGEAYLAAGQGRAAAGEFQKILDHGGLVWNCWTGALAHLGLARANALQFRTSRGAEADAARVRALAAYKDFVMLWKEADPSIPVMKAARTEYSRLQ